MPNPPPLQNPEHLQLHEVDEKLEALKVEVPMPLVFTNPPFLKKSVKVEQGGIPIEVFGEQLRVDFVSTLVQVEQGEMICKIMRFH